MVGADIFNKLLNLLFTKLLELVNDLVFDLFFPGLDAPADKFTSLVKEFLGLELWLLRFGVLELELMLEFNKLSPFFFFYMLR